jgi:hypothetical protein
MGIISRLNKFLEGRPSGESYSSILEKMQNRCNIEIAARMTRRAEIHENSKDDYLKRCAALDRVSAQRILDLERTIALSKNHDATKIANDFQKFLQFLREP